MKIIRNSKDIYDYVGGALMVDDDVVYDRRAEHLFKRDDRYVCVGAEYELTYSERQPIRSVAVLECGRHRMLFELEINAEEVAGSTAKRVKYVVRSIKPTYVGEVEFKAKTDTVPLRLYTDVHIRGAYYWTYRNERRPKEFLRALETAELANGVDNPIISTTCLAAVVDPYKVWNRIYEFISSLKDVPFTDNRTDAEKIASHGFDKKTSFSNM